jgi:hypothetical protein
MTGPDHFASELDSEENFEQLTEQPERCGIPTMKDYDHKNNRYSIIIHDLVIKLCCGE